MSVGTMTDEDWRTASKRAVKRERAVEAKASRVVGAARGRPAWWRLAHKSTQSALWYPSYATTSFKGPPGPSVQFALTLTFLSRLNTSICCLSILASTALCTALVRPSAAVPTSNDVFTLNLVVFTQRFTNVALAARTVWCC